MMIAPSPFAPAVAAGAAMPTIGGADPAAAAFTLTLQAVAAPTAGGATAQPGTPLSTASASVPATVQQPALAFAATPFSLTATPPAEIATLDVPALPISAEPVAAPPVPAAAIVANAPTATTTPATAPIDPAPITSEPVVTPEVATAAAGADAQLSAEAPQPSLQPTTPLAPVVAAVVAQAAQPKPDAPVETAPAKAGKKTAAQSQAPAAPRANAPAATELEIAGAATAGLPAAVQTALRSRGEVAEFEVQAPATSDAMTVPADQIQTITPNTPLPVAERAAAAPSLPVETGTKPGLAVGRPAIGAADAPTAAAQAAPAETAKAASATAGDAPVFALAAETQTGGTETQGLPSQLLGQTVPTASRPLNPQQIYPAQAQTSGSVSAQPGRIGREMGVEIARRITAGQEEMVIRLNPQEMGRIEVRLSFDESGAVRAILASESPAALDMLRRDSGDLARSLADAGIRSDAQSFRFDRGAGESGSQRGQGHGNPQGRQSDGRNLAGGAEDEQNSPAYRQLRGSGQVDLIA